MIKVAHTKMEVVSEINKMKRVLYKHRNMKRCYFCGSGTHMLDNCDIKDTMERDRWFSRKLNVQNHRQQSKYKGDEKIVYSDADVSVSSTKTVSRGGLQISLYGSK